MAPPSIAGPPGQPMVVEIDSRYLCYLTQQAPCGHAAPPQGPQVAAAHLFRLSDCNAQLEAALRHLLNFLKDSLNKQSW